MEVAIFARYLGSTWKPDMRSKKLLFEPIMRPELNFCDKHPKRLYFDDKACPCCGLMAEHKAGKLQFMSKAQAEADFLRLTSERS
jgi:hypothetical protein